MDLHVYNIVRLQDLCMEKKLSFHPQKSVQCIHVSTRPAVRLLCIGFYHVSTIQLSVLPYYVSDMFFA